MRKYITETGKFMNSWGNVGLKREYMVQLTQ